jgi:serine/threonine-protein kinase
VGRTVAVKTLRPERRDERGAIDLLREAWITGTVDHPNVVPVHYVDLDEDGQPVIVLKRVDGVEWCRLITDASEVERRFGTTDLLAWNLGILLQLLNALRFAHARGIVHRDLKPANVMIGEFGEVYLLDWGIAVSLRADELGRLPLATNATELAGTPMYMAPEMLGRGAAISERTDIYLAGAVLHELITGRPPHTGTSIFEVLASVARSTIELPADVPTELARICSRAMRVDPNDRFATVDDLRAALVAYLEHRGSARLLDVANHRLERLLDVLASAGTGKGSNLDDEIHGLFGACRFGFHEALAAWRDNTEATNGLVQATTAVAEYELASGDPRAAMALLAELTDPPIALVERARRASADQAVAAAKAEHLRREHDVVVGSRTRAFAMSVLGVLFVGVPLVQALTGREPTYGVWGAWSLGFSVLTTGFGIWARESLTATVLNRRSFMMVQWLFVTHLLLLATGWRLGLPIEATEILIMLMWVVFSGLAAITVDRRLAPGCVAFALAFALALGSPEYRKYLMSAANFVYAVVVVYQWLPRRQRTDP